LGSAPSEISPKASIEPPGASKGLQSPSENFSPFLSIENYQWLTGERRPKNRRPRRAADMGRVAEANGPYARESVSHSPTQATAYPRFRGLSSSIPILACRRPDRL
jgi:hypothetical protein